MVLWSIVLVLAVGLVLTVVFAIRVDRRGHTVPIKLHASERAEFELGQGSRTAWNNHIREIGTTGSGGPL